jgi:hypothetical protein
MAILEKLWFGRFSSDYTLPVEKKGGGRLTSPNIKLYICNGLITVGKTITFGCLAWKVSRVLPLSPSMVGLIALVAISPEVTFDTIDRFEPLRREFPELKSWWQENGLMHHLGNVGCWSVFIGTATGLSLRGSLASLSQLKALLFNCTARSALIVVPLAMIQFFTTTLCAYNAADFSKQKFTFRWPHD